MWRLNVTAEYKDRVFEVERFFLANRHGFKSGDVLLIQLVRRDERKRIRRVRGYMIFDRFSENSKEDSRSIYGREWAHELIPSRVVKFDEEDRFDLSFLLGARAQRYDNQAEVVLVDESDQAKIIERIRKIEGRSLF